MMENKTIENSLENNRPLQIILGVIGVIALVAIAYVIMWYESQTKAPDVVAPYVEDGKVTLTREETARREAMIADFKSGRKVTLSKEETARREAMISDFMGDNE